MSARPGGETTGRIKRELAVEAHERAVHLIDLEAVRRVLLGIPAVLTELERGAVIALCDAGGLDATVTAQGLGVAPSTVDWTVRRHRKRAAALTRDLQAAAMLRPAAELVTAVAGSDAEAVASVLSSLSLQQFAALAVVLAAAVSDPSILPDAGVERDGIPTFDDAGV